MIIIYRINSNNIKSINDLIYFYYSMLTANAYLDGEIKIYTDFNYFEFFAYLPFEFYPDFRDDETFKRDVLSNLNNYLLIEDPKIIFFETIQHTNFMSVDAVINEIGKISPTLGNKLIDRVNNNNIIT